MSSVADTWVLILAGGDGSRLRGLTMGASGTPIPKQFWPYDGSRTLLQQTLGRAATLVPRDRIVVVVTERHRSHWEPALAEHPWDNVVVQPQNRGTAPGILLPVLRILSLDPAARILVLPSDHHVEREGVLRGAVEEALDVLPQLPERLVLLGIHPEVPESDYGWILPSRRLEGRVQAVEAFVEKPDPETTRRLRVRGGLWNSFVFACTGRAMMDLYRKVAPWLVDAFTEAAQADLGDGRAVVSLYRSLPPCDFSRFILQRATSRLAVLGVPPCGWADVGTPARANRYLFGHAIASPAEGLPSTRSRRTEGGVA